MRLDKLHLWAIISVAAAVFAFAQTVSAGEVGRYQRPDTGLRAALDWCEAKGGRLTWAEKAPYVLSEDGATATLTGNVLVFTCKAREAAPAYLLSWQRPTSRANGAPLPADQIAGYQITINGKTEMVTGTSYTLRSAPAGTVIQLRTVDTSTPPLLSEAAKITL